MCIKGSEGTKWVKENWVCDCAVGWIIPYKYNICVLCGKARFPHYGKDMLIPFNPLLYVNKIIYVQ